MNRHFTATGLAFDGEKVLVVKHATLGWWLPPGGHLEENEDPAQAVLREVEQETGLACEIVSDEHFRYAGEGIASIARPFAILQEDLPDDDGTVHQHIDHIYLLRPISDPAILSPQLDEVTAARWVPVGKIGGLSTPASLPPMIDAAYRYVAQPSSSAPGARAGNEEAVGR